MKTRKIVSVAISPREDESEEVIATQITSGDLKANITFLKVSAIISLLSILSTYSMGILYVSLTSTRFVF